jgi:hypothetical protein
MKDLLDRIIEAKYKENSFFYDHPVRPKPGAPADEYQLGQLDDYLARKGLRVPPGYREYLSIYNGIESVFNYSLSLLPVAEVMRDDHGIVEETIDEFPTCCQFVIAAGNTPEFIAFDTATWHTELGYEAVWVTADTTEWRQKSFEDLLTSYLDVLERNISAQENDRKNLQP